MVHTLTRMRKSARLGVIGGVIAIMIGASLTVVLGVASASTGPCGTLASGGATPPVYIDCAVPPASTPYSTYTDQQQIDLAIGPNTLVSSTDAHGGDITAIECEYTNGVGGAGDPPNDNYCSAPTAAEDFPYSVHANGSFDYTADNQGDLLSIYALPDSQFPQSSIVCNSTNPCVWYVGEDYTNFTAPHVFSNPFLVSSSSGTAPVITSTNSATVSVGSALNFAIATSGSPAATVSESGALPANVTFSAHSGGTATLAGTPADGKVGTYPITIHATNGVGSPVTQDFTLRVTTAALTITASSQSVTQGSAVASVTAGYSGFVNSDTPASLTKQPTCSTAATSTSPSGNYTSTCSGATDPNYTISYVNGTVIIHPSFYITTSQSAFTNATDGTPYSVALATAGADGPVKWKLTSAKTTLPKGLKVHPGAVSGTPKTGKHADAAGHYVFTVSATVKAAKTHPAQTASATFTITIAAG